MTINSNCLSEYFLPVGSCTGSMAVFFACFFLFVVMLAFLLIVGPPKNKVDYGAFIYAFSNIISMVSSSALAIRLYALYFVFDSIYEQGAIAVLGTTGFIMSFVAEEATVIYYVCVVSLTTFYYFVFTQSKKVGVYLFIDLGVCIAVAIIVFNDQPYANYIVIIASSFPRILMYFVHEAQKIMENKPEITETFIDRIRFTCYLIAIAISWTVFTYPFRFIAVLTATKTPKYFYYYYFVCLVVLFVLAGVAEKLGALIAYGIAMTLGLLYRDFLFEKEIKRDFFTKSKEDLEWKDTNPNAKDWVLYFFEFVCFWTVCVPVYFEANIYFPLMLVMTALYGTLIVLFGSLHNAQSYWKKSQYGLHFCDFLTKGFALGAVLPLVAYSLWLLFMYGYQYFSTLIGQFISF